jgi:hypothetical protein
MRHRIISDLLWKGLGAASSIVHGEAADVRIGSGSCENALSEALTPRDFDEAAAVIILPSLRTFPSGSAPDAGIQLSWAAARQDTGACSRRLCPHRRQERADAHDVHDAREIVGQHVQNHLGGNPRQRSSSGSV